jgi:hypothetical protein
LAVYVTTVNQYLVTVLLATSNKRGRLSIPLTKLLQLVSNRYLLIALVFGSFCFAEAQSEGDGQLADWQKATFA